MIPRTSPNRANPPSETYECFTHKRDVEACSQGPVVRADVDLAVLAYFEQVGLDLDATREQLRGAIARKAEETRALLKTAQDEASSATDRLARVKRDYLEGNLTAGEWRDLKAELEPEQAAANAAVDRLTRQLEDQEAENALDDVEAELGRLLDTVRAAVEGKSGDDKGAKEVSASLLRLFDSFTFHAGIPDAANVELIDVDCWIEPSLRPYQGGVEPSRQAENNCLEGFTT